MTAALFDSALTSVALLHRGKVRDLYALDDERILIVTTDRLSAFDVVLPRPIPGKGAVLTSLTRFWMQRFSARLPNHELEADLSRWLTPEEQARCQGRSVVARRLKPLPIEAVARGYLIGSGWKDYQSSGVVCGIALPAGLALAERLAEPLFTPAFKAAVGEHDPNISYAEVERLVGPALAERVRHFTLLLYSEAASYAAERGLLIADTKFEFGLDASGTLYLIDEVLTPDSSRFWPADAYRVGQTPPSFDKQPVRDYLETLGWDKHPPGPELPDAIVAQTAQRYREAQRRLQEA